MTFQKFPTKLYAAAAVLIFAAGAFGQDDKQQKMADKVAKRQDKLEGRYNKIKDFAQKEYDAEPDFREAVNRRYGQLKQKHTRLAYLVNTQDPTRSLVRLDRENQPVIDNSLYANPMAQDFVNRVGQSLVPAGSAQLYSFKIIQNPVPEAVAMSTGTIYITTGYLSIIDNEAQLAYILGHEVAHVEKNHWFQDVLVEIGAEPFAKKNPLKVWVWGVKDAFKDALLDPVAMALAAKMNLSSSLEWKAFQEDEADRDALKYMFDRNYDVREVVKLYERMKKVASDPRSQTGFIADSDRIGERLTNINAVMSPYVKAGANSGAVDLADSRQSGTIKAGTRGLARMLGEAMTPEIKRKLEAGELIASSEEFQSTMALVKRDNGLRALQFDMFVLARSNLEDSLGIRSNDPYAYYYYGKALKQTARHAGDTSKALVNLNQAISADKRQTIAEPFLFRAMLRLGERNPNEAPMIANDLRKYVEIFQRENAGALPPNMTFVYDFMQDLEVLDYRASPAANTADAPKSVFGSLPPTESAPAPAQTQNTVISAPAPTPTRSKGKRP